MNAKKAKQLRRTAKALAQDFGAPEKTYQLKTSKMSTGETVVLGNCQRLVYQLLKKEAK